MNGEVLWIASRNGEKIVFKLQWHDSIELRHRFTDLFKNLFFELELFERDGLHPHLLSQRLYQLLIGDQLHIFRDAAKECSGLLLLFFEHNL